MMMKSILPRHSITTNTAVMSLLQRVLLLLFMLLLLLLHLTLTNTGAAVVVVVTAQTTTTTTTTTSVPLPFRMNCGGPLLISSSNPQTRWESDTSYNLQNKGNRRNLCSTVNVTNVPPTGTNIPNALYCSQRFYNPNNFIPPYQYQIPVINNAYYTVILHFAELVHTTNNSRIMDISIEDTLVLDHLDVVAQTGGIYRRAYQYTVPQPIYVIDHVLTITLQASQSQAMISGMEIHSTTSVVTPVTVPSTSITTTTKAPIQSPSPTKLPVSVRPTKVPTKTPTNILTKLPTLLPISVMPTKVPTKATTNILTKLPTLLPVSVMPTKVPTKTPTNILTKLPTLLPVSVMPTKVPTKTPTNIPTKVQVPTSFPTSKTPTHVPTKAPSKTPTNVPTSAPVVTPTSVSGIVVSRINCGSTTNTIMNNVTWSADQYFLSGRGYDTCGTTTSTNHSIYCTSRFFQTTRGTPFRYNIPVPYNNASYQVHLHFAEQYYNTVSKRVFDVSVEGIIVLDNFDIVREAPGKFTPKVVTENALVTDGTITIDFAVVTGNPSINGIEIIYMDGSAPPSAPIMPVPTTKTPTKQPTKLPTKVPSKVPTKIPVVAPIATPPTVSAIVLNRINCGSTSNVTMNNVTWSADQFFASGRLYNTCGNATNNIYCTSRFFQVTRGTPFRYTIPVPYNNSSYQVLLHFAEQYHNAVNQRVFDVFVEGLLVLDNFDIIRDAPGKFIPEIVTINTFVTDGAITIDFSVVTGDPSINGIEIIYSSSNRAPLSPPAQAPTSSTRAPIASPVPSKGNLLYRINSGSSSQVIVPPNNLVWDPDQFVSTGLPYDNCNNMKGSIYCTGRYFQAAYGTPFRYDIPVPTLNRTYLVRLHFAESYHQATSSRVFDVFIEGVIVVDNLDIFLVAGGNNSYILTAFPFVSDGSITIDFVSGTVGDPQINGIEVFDSGEPIPPPTLTPMAPPPNSAPVIPTSNTTTTTFQDIAINCGGPKYLEQSGLRNWSEDNFFSGGSTYSITNVPVANTVDDPIYQSERVGTFSYAIPVPVGTYEILIHLAELVFTSADTRIFNLTIETQKFDLIDIFALAGGSAKAVTLQTTVVVDDGFASIAVAKVISEPKLNGIEIITSVPHVAHSVSNGPYFAVDILNVGFATVNVDGSESHTHGTDLFLTNWTWKNGAQTLGTGESTSFNLSVGTYDITLTVVDNGDFQATEATSVTVYPFGFPDIASVTPSSGSIIGGELVTIHGTCFNFSAADTIVHFGTNQLTGNALQIINSTTIVVSSPQIPISVAVFVSVQTPLGRSKDATFTYASSTPISFSTTKLVDIAQPTSAEFGPDGKLYVGTLKGTLAKITLNNDFTSLVSIVSAVVQPGRAILGITFDPFDAGETFPPVYISSSLLFHGESKSSSGTAINGKISRILGSNLDIIEDVVTGLPVCDLDHAVNQITFGNQGELYINIGSNTNGGVPGRLSGSGIMKENYFSAATNVANLAHPMFDGFIEYDALDDGSPVNTTGVSVFAPGLRNPFGVTLHSNGNLYGTDNGPNAGYGDMKVGCRPSDLLDDQQREDKLVHIMANKYYGHPNPKRVTDQGDTRQCFWRNPTEPTNAMYQAPIGVVQSAATGILEYRADHFNRQLRGNLIHVKYKSGLLRTVLSSDGLSANPLTIPGLKLLGRDGLDVAQAPNGNLIEVRYLKSAVWVSRPIETTTSMMRISSLFPYRGGLAGGTFLRIFGINFGSVPPTVTVGALDCPVDTNTITSTEIRCTLPGQPPGLVDVVVTSATTGTYTFQKGYRYITGTGFSS